MTTNPPWLSSVSIVRGGLTPTGSEVADVDGIALEVNPAATHPAPKTASSQLFTGKAL